MKMQNGFMSLKEAMHFLDVDQAEIEEFVRTHKLHAYKFGGSYLRFKKDELLRLKHDLHKEEKKEETFVDVEVKKKSWLNFWTYNNFYILSALLLTGLLFYLM